MGGANNRTPDVFMGSAADLAHHGWFVGHFMNECPPLQSDAVEVKWSVYTGGEERAGWVANRVATTLAVLVRGRFRLLFPDREAALQNEGDFVSWGPHVPHSWCADGPAVVLTVRWPSLPEDSYDVTEARSYGGEAQPVDVEHRSASS
ncbi:MAG: signal peptidase I [Thermomicrobiales bacterium]|nr:signal peptidase I [Thermomicrobiales bacterium]